MANFIAIGLFTGFIYSLVALGYTLVYGILRLINFAHSEVFMCGAFGGYFYLREFVNPNVVPSGAASVFWVVSGLLVSGAVGGIVAIAPRALRLPTLAPPQRAAAHLPDLGDRGVLLPHQLRRQGVRPLLDGPPARLHQRHRRHVRSVRGSRRTT